MARAQGPIPDTALTADPLSTLQHSADGVPSVQER